MVGLARADLEHAASRVAIDGEDVGTGASIVTLLSTTSWPVVSVIVAGLRLVEVDRAAIGGAGKRGTQ